jgi:hypothetical protein
VIFDVYFQYGITFANLNMLRRSPILSLITSFKNNMYMLKNIMLPIVVMLLSLCESKAQFQGLVVQGGLSSAFSRDGVVTPNGQGHYGWTIGADARMLDGGLYFIMGGHYHSTTLASQSSPNPFGKHDWAYVVGRFGVGFTLVRITEKIALRSKLLAAINFNTKFPSAGLNADYNRINDSFAGVGTGLGLTLGHLEFDLDYQYGVLNAYYKKPDTNFDLFSLVAGFRF